MKKTILFLIGAFAIFAVLTLNVTFAKSNQSIELSMKSVIPTAQTLSANSNKKLYSDGNGKMCCKTDNDHTCGAADCPWIPIA